MAERWRQPFAASEAARRKMAAQRRKDTEPELAIRRALHGRGLRYYVHRRPLPELRREADIVFPKARVAVFIDGCFWHGCPDHGSRRIDVNQWYWPEKIAGNRARDADTNARLSAQGWVALRAWEHEDPVEVAERIRSVVTAAGIRLAHRRPVGSQAASRPASDPASTRG